MSFHVRRKHFYEMNMQQLEAGQILFLFSMRHNYTIESAYNSVNCEVFNLIFFESC